MPRALPAAIEPVLHDLVADEIERSIGPGSAVVIARWYQLTSTPGWDASVARAELERRHDHDPTFRYELEEVLLDQPQLKLGTRQIVLLTGFPTSLAGRAFWQKESRRELLLLRRTGDFSPDARLELAVPVDDERGPAVIEAVRARLKR